MATPTLTGTITDQLDRLESNLPAVPARIVHLQRALASAAYDRTSSVVQALSESTKAFLDTARVSGKTVTGQARAAGEQVVDTARTSAKTVAGQASAQGRKVSESAAGEAEKLLDDAIDAVEDTPGTGHPYEQWTKAELLERAQELDIEGRSGMNKNELIKALRRA